MQISNNDVLLIWCTHILKGDQAAFHNLIKTGKIDMKQIQDYGVDQLRSYCKECNIPSSGKSQVHFKSLTKLKSIETHKPVCVKQSL